MKKRRKIIMDMDIGDDIDDAIALYAAMRQDFDIIGITTVFRNTVERARMAKKLLLTYGRGYENVPVFAGYGTPMGAAALPARHTPHYTPDLEDERYIPNGTAPEKAIDFIIDACRKYGKELTVIAIGPFTNIAYAIQKGPEALNLCDKVAIMGGAYYKQYADWNVICDVTAADIMFKGLKNLECLGADVTHLMVGEQALYANLLDYQGSEPGHRYLTELCRLWKTDRPNAKLLLHDPLVIYYVADPSICTMKAADVVVMTEGYSKGMTLNVDAYGKRWLNTEAYQNHDETHKALVALAANRESFNSRILADFDT